MKSSAHWVGDYFRLKPEGLLHLHRPSSNPWALRFWMNVERGCEDGAGIELSRQDGAGEALAKGSALPGWLGFSLSAISLCSLELRRLKRATYIA